MKLGMPTLIELDTIEENMSLCKELNLDFIELNMNLPQFNSDEIDVTSYLELKNRHGIFYTIHLPEELDIANLNNTLKESSIEVISNAIELSKLLDIKVLNLHMNLGTYFNLPNAKIFLYDKYYNLYLESIINFSKFISEKLKDTDIKLAIENTGIYNVEFIKLGVQELLKNPNIILTYDIGHEYSSGENDTGFLKLNKNKIKHMHIHDGIGKKNHLPLFTGEINILEKLELAKLNNCLCVIEIKTILGLKKSKLNLKKFSNIFSLDVKSN